jgi:hypothetical protein
LDLTDEGRPELVLDLSEEDDGRRALRGLLQT